jgi:hypothetical protein
VACAAVCAAAVPGAVLALGYADVAVLSRRRSMPRSRAALRLTAARLSLRPPQSSAEELRQLQA